jgi:enoyl-[acyl-carrier protein] reductase I
LPKNGTLGCDVTNDQEIGDLFADLGEHWDSLDGIVHCLAFAPGDQLDGNYVDVTTRQGFLLAHEISSYSFVALAKAGKPLMRGRNGSLLTLSYLGAVRSLPNYNVMGLAKASLEANVRYMASSLDQKEHVSTPYPPVLSEPSLHPGSRVLGKCWSTMPSKRLYAEM